MATRSSDPRVTYPEVRIQVRDLVRVVGISTPLPHGVSIRGNSFYRAPGVNGHRKLLPDAPISGTPREIQEEFKDGTV